MLVLGGKTVSLKKSAFVLYCGLDVERVRITQALACVTWCGNNRWREGESDKTSSDVRRNIGARWRNHRCLGKAVSIKHKCVHSCLSHPTNNRIFSAPYYTILSSVACLALPHFSTLSHKIFVKNLLNIMCVLIFSTTFVWNISLPKNASAMYHNIT